MVVVRNRGLGPDDDVAVACACGQLCVARLPVGQAIPIPTWHPGGRWPVPGRRCARRRARSMPRTAGPRCDPKCRGRGQDQDAPARRVLRGEDGEAGGGQHRDEGHPQNARDRRQPGKRRVDEGVARKQPWKAREEPSEYPLQCRPKRCERQRVGDADGRRAARCHRLFEFRPGARALCGPGGPRTRWNTNPKSPVNSAIPATNSATRAMAKAGDAAPKTWMLT